MFRTVLFPIDHSRAALETAVTVLKLVQQYNSRLVLLSVVDPEDTTMANATEVGQLLQQAHDTFERAGGGGVVLEHGTPWGSVASA